MIFMKAGLWVSTSCNSAVALPVVPSSGSNDGKSFIRPSSRLQYQSMTQRWHVQATATLDEATEEDFIWKGSDEYSELHDRQDKEPIALPLLETSKRIVLVRHGQSTWNAEGRVQGSTDFSVLTQKGIAQAETTREMLKNDNFDTLFKSPLRRASKTGEIIWGDRQGQIVVMPSLREIDLYSFQGLLKDEGKQRYGEQYTKWQKEAYRFEIDKQYPIRELWYRASLAWQDILGRDDVTSALVAAHNAVNQAMVATALGFPPTMFRRMLQSNGATTVIDFSPRPGQAPIVTLNRLNQTPGPPFGTDTFLKGKSSRLILVRAATVGGTEGRLLGHADEALDTLGHAQAQKVADLLLDCKLHTVFSSPLRRASETAKPIVEFQGIDNGKKPQLEILEGLKDRDWGSSQGRTAQEVRSSNRCSLEEPLQQFEKRTREAMDRICRFSHASDGGKTVAVVAHAPVLSALICHVLGLPEIEENLSLFRTDAGSITVVDLPDPEKPAFGIVRCMNYTAHLGRWAIPVTREDLDSEKLCGIDGCF